MRRVGGKFIHSTCNWKKIPIFRTNRSIYPLQYYPFASLILAPMVNGLAWRHRTKIIKLEGQSRRPLGPCRTKAWTQQCYLVCPLFALCALR